MNKTETTLADIMADGYQYDPTLIFSDELWALAQIRKGAAGMFGMIHSPEVHDAAMRLLGERDE